jgi:hypothetical protein
MSSDQATAFKTDFVKGVILTLSAVNHDPSAVMSVLGMFGYSNPLTALVVKYGSLGLAEALKAITAPTFTDADVEAHLASKGFKVEPISLESFYG